MSVRCKDNGGFCTLCNNCDIKKCSIGTGCRFWKNGVCYNPTFDLEEVVPCLADYLDY